MPSRSMARTVRTLALATVFCIVLADRDAAHAQVKLLEPDPISTPNWSDTFLTLGAGGCAVRYRSGGLDRAHHVLRRLDLVTRQLNDWSEVPVPLAVYLLDRAGWEEIGLQGVYGLPQRTGPTAVALAAEGDDETVALWRELLDSDSVPLVPGVPLRGTPEQAGTLAIADVFLQIEAARGFVQRAGLLGDRAWVGEVAAHLAALTLLRRYEESRVPEIEAFFERLGATAGRDGAYPLEAFAPAPVPRNLAELRRWLWYQAAFFDAARALVDRRGRSALQRLQKLADRRGNLRESELLSEFEELRAWHASITAGSP